MAFTDLAEELESALGYGAGVFDKNWASGKARAVQEGYSYRDVPAFAKRTDSVSTAEISTWRKNRMPPRGVRFTTEVAQIRARVRFSAQQDAELEALREVWSRVRVAKTEKGVIRTWRGVEYVVSRARAAG